MRIDIFLDTTRGCVHLTFSREISPRSNRALYDALHYGLEALDGVEGVTMRRYSAIATVAEHVETAQDVAVDIEALLHEDGGEVAELLHDEFEDVFTFINGVPQPGADEAELPSTG